MIQWTLGVYQIKDLKPNPKNPRYITKQQQQLLGELIDKFGLIDKPIINKDRTIIGGHQRISVLKKKKQKTVECWVPDRMLEEEEIQHLMVGLNLNQGSWDFDLLANHFEPLDLLNWGFTEEQLLGFEEVDEEEGADKKKKKIKQCPSCGHEF